MPKIGRAAHIPPFHVMDVIAAANARQAALPAGAPHVIHMEVGQPGTGAPAGAVAAASAALQAGRPMGYTEAFGLPLLRERIAAHILDWYGVHVPRARIAVTTGASGAFPLAFLAAFDPGDRVALAAPFYPPYVNILTALGIEPVILQAGAESRFQPTVALLEQLDRKPQGLIVASPCNPVGSMLHPDDFAALAAWCGAHDVRLISDEIYHGLTYGQTPATAANIPGAIVINSFSKHEQNRLPERGGVAVKSLASRAGLTTATLFSESAIIIGSFSKYWCMTGWRVGWMVLPDDLLRPVEVLLQNLFISAPHISQVAALAAMECGSELDLNVARYARSRDLLLQALPEIGFNRLAPAEGAFYLWADVRDRTDDSGDFCARMLADIGIAATPGIDFDRVRGHRYVRFSYCGPEEDMAEAVKRLKLWEHGRQG